MKLRSILLGALAVFAPVIAAQSGSEAEPEIFKYEVSPWSHDRPDLPSSIVGGL